MTRVMTEKEYKRFASRLRAYRRAFFRFLYNFETEKAAAILPRLKMQESEEMAAYNAYMNE